MLKKIEVSKFRAIENMDFDIGNYITVFAGWNATGKSTLLALLAHSCELKKKDGETLTKKQFQSDFEEILKGSKEFDKSGSNLFRIYCKIDDVEVKKTFRITWQKDKKTGDNNRFRVIPKDDNGSASKFNMPILYLGLSRLYPFGETDDSSIKFNPKLLKDNEDIAWFNKNHNEILSSGNSDNKLTQIDISSAKKQTIGISNNKYDYNANSLGQDNLSQILLSILSFKKLKSKQGRNFKGGALIIDELDASLHPLAQLHLFEFLVKQAKEIGMQFIFTTHSLTLIERICRITDSSKDSNIILHYLTRSNDDVLHLENPKFSEINQDLLLLDIESNTEKNKIFVYAEDEEARWFIKNLCSEYIGRIELNDVCIGCSSLIDIINIEPVFKKYLIIFDGDAIVHNKRIKDINNILFLPSDKSPEKVFYDFIYSTNSKRYFREAVKEDNRFKKEYFNKHNYESVKKEKNYTEDRMVYKEWFKKHKSIFEKTRMFEFWKEVNSELVKKFMDDFKVKYNNVAKLNRIPEIYNTSGQC